MSIPITSNMCVSPVQCSVTCGHGSRHRKVTCFRGEQEVIDTHCDYKKKPTSKLECYMGTCPRWITDDWGEVSNTRVYGMSSVNTCLMEGQIS